MREIKFRGKRINNGEWAYGYLIQDYTGDLTGVIGAYAILGESYAGNTTYDRVDLETVGQYTGLKDKDGKETYEGDICEVEYKDGRTFVGEIRYVRTVFTFRNGYLYRVAEDVLDEFCAIEVIDNAFDHPHLLRGESTS